MTQPEDPQQQPAQPPADPAAPPPSSSDVPLPPGWGQQQTAPPASPQQPITPVYQPAPQQPDQPIYQPPQDPFQTTTMTPAGAQLPASGPPAPYGDPQTYAYPPFAAVEQPPKKRNKGLIITAVVLGVVLVLCAAGGVGAFFVLRDTEGKGAASPKEAAQDFLTAIYKDGDAASAEKLVCSEARDRDAIEGKVKEVEDQKAGLKDPRITWNSPKIDNETAEQADTTVTVKLITADEKVSEQTLKLTLVKREGWFVCEVSEQKK